MGKRRRSMSAFYDLNIELDGVQLEQRSDTVATALQLGYSGIAHNHVIKGSMAHADTCKIRPLDLKEVAAQESDVAQSAKFHQEVLGVPIGRLFRQYSRLTVVVDSTIQAAALNAANPVIRSYDLVAIRPINQKAFDQACTHLEVDVISLDLCHRLPFRLKPPSVKAAIKRGIFFEITFSAAFVDLKARRELFANAQMLQGLTRGRSIIVSSGARRSVDLRGPNDITNMGTLFGLSREAAKAAVSTNCEAVILHGLARKKTYKSVIVVENHLPDGIIGSDEAWFDVPKVWDPLSNTRMGDFLPLPEKSEGPSGSCYPNQIIDNEGHRENEGSGHIEKEGSGKSVLRTVDQKGKQNNALLHKERDFIGIDVGENKKGKSVGSRRRVREGGGKKEPSKDKSQKRKRR